jgi:parallel beta-helix repeat protein
VEISNTVNGGSLLYVKNADLNNATISTAGIGQLILCNVRNARVTGLSLANATVAVLMVHSSRVTLDHSSFSNNKYSVYAYFSDHCTIANSRSSNSRSGFYLYESDYNLITGCNATSANDYGIWMQYSDGNVVTNCSTDTSYYSIGQQYSLGNAITNNMIAHGSYQLYAYNCRYGSIRDNTCERGYCAMYVYGTCYDLTVTGNRLFNSSWYGIYTSGCNGNFFFGNKLVGNRGAGQVYSSSHVQAYDSADGLNFWDNIAGVGNYWGDWTYPDANHDGIVDYPYVLTGNVKNKDRYPVSDTTPPELTITAPTEGQSVMTSDIDATWSGSDKQSGISRYEAQVDDGSWVNLSEQTHYALSLSGGQHTLGVRAYDRALNLRERYVTFVIVSVPDAPTNTIAVAGASQVMVSWHPGSDGGSAIIEYRILRSLVSGDYSAAVTAAVAPTATTYADSGVTAGTTYYYVVKARNAKGDSLASNEAMVVFGSGTLPPDSPTLSLFASSVGADYVCLAWIAPGNTGSSPITAYKVYRGTQPGGTSSLIATVTGAETTYYLDSGLAVGIYYYRVSAVNTIEGPRSNEVVATAGVVTGAPEKVTSISTSSHDNRIDLSWSAPSQGASAITQYRVYRSTVPGNLVLIGLPTGTSYTDGTVIKGQTYYYWIVAVNAQGQGPLSTQMKATATEPPASDMLLPIMLIIVVIAVVVFLLFLMKRRGKTTPIPSKQRGRVRATGRLSDGERGQELKGDRGFTQPASPPLPGTPPPPTPVPRPVPTATGLCPSCGKTYPFVQGMEFCPECGANLFK